MKLKKVLRVFLIAAFFLGVMTRTVSAAEPALNLEPGDIQPYWTNVSSITCTLTFYATEAECVAKVKCNSGTTQINSTLILERKVGSSWQYVTSWDKDVSGQSVSYGELYDCISGSDYRIIVEADVYRNGVWENVSKTSATKRCG